MIKESKKVKDSWDGVEALPLVSEEVLAALQQNTHLGEFAILGVESVGPQIGSELRRKGILAVVSSLIGMLIYIWFRFELRFGVGALVAVTHDVLIVLGLRDERSRHRRLARIAWPIWIYVSITGVLIYLLLYPFNPAPPALAGGHL